MNAPLVHQALIAKKQQLLSLELAMLAIIAQKGQQQQLRILAQLELTQLPPELELSLNVLFAKQEITVTLLAQDQ